MPDIEGVPYEATGGKLDQATAATLAARHREAASAGSTAATSALTNAKAYTDQKVTGLATTAAMQAGDQKALADAKAYTDQQLADFDSFVGVPIFETLAEAEAWEAKNPGKRALTLEPSTPDTTAPTWNATLTVGTPTDKRVVVIASSLATDDRRVDRYEVTYNGTTWSTITPSGKNFTLTGTAGTAYSSTKLRAKDAAGNVSTALAVPSYTMAATPPHPYIEYATSLGVESLVYFDGGAPKNVGTVSSPAGTMISPVYGAGVGGFGQSLTSGRLQFANYLPAGVGAFTIAVVIKTQPEGTSNAYAFNDWNKKLSVTDNTVSWGAWAVTVSPAVAPKRDAVQHVALTWDGSTSKFYVDGALVGQGPITTPPDASAALVFGANGTAGFPSPAALACALVDTKKALTAAQVKQLSDQVAR